jgi:hypothetical protein
LQAQRLALMEQPRRAVVLVANKSDVEERAVAPESGRFFCSSRELPFVETSARTGANVQLAFALLAKSIRQRRNAPKTSLDAVAGFTVIPSSPVAAAVEAEKAEKPRGESPSSSWARDEDVKFCTKCNAKVNFFFFFFFFFFCLFFGWTLTLSTSFLLC